MRAYNDRRVTLRWTKFGPPLAVASGSPSDGVALLGRATSPPCATLLAETLPDAIPAVQSNVIWL
ncbi:MAG: hypothetical protein ABIQ66_01585 [Novosphingobium sp.]